MWILGLCYHVTITTSNYYLYPKGKALNNIAPNYICSKIQMAENCHSHNTRKAAKNHLQIPSFNTKFGMRTFCVSSIKTLERFT